MKPGILFTAVYNVNGSAFIGLDTKTKVLLSGGRDNYMQGLVTKTMKGASVMAFQNKSVNGYREMIRRRLIAEGKDPDSFQLSERVWGKRIPNLPIVRHSLNEKIQYYLEVIFLRPGIVEYQLDGYPIHKEDIIGLIDAMPACQGGLTNKVIIRCFRSESITELRINKQAFR
jgi:hypothetical protein